MKKGTEAPFAEPQAVRDAKDKACASLKDDGIDIHIPAQTYRMVHDISVRALTDEDTFLLAREAYRKALVHVSKTQKNLDRYARHVDKVGLSELDKDKQWVYLTVVRLQTELLKATAKIMQEFRKKELAPRRRSVKVVVQDYGEGAQEPVADILPRLSAENPRFQVP